MNISLTKLFLTRNYLDALAQEISITTRSSM